MHEIDLWHEIWIYFYVVQKEYKLDLKLYEGFETITQLHSLEDAWFQFLSGENLDRLVDVRIPTVILIFV